MEGKIKMNEGRDYTVVIEDWRDNIADINDLTFSEALKIVESTLFSDVGNVYIWNKGKLYSRMEFLELIK